MPVTKPAPRLAVASEPSGFANAFKKAVKKTLRALMKPTPLAANGAVQGMQTGLVVGMRSGNPWGLAAGAMAGAALGYVSGNALKHHQGGMMGSLLALPFGLKKGLVGAALTATAGFAVGSLKPTQRLLSDPRLQGGLMLLAGGHMARRAVGSMGAIGHLGRLAMARQGLNVSTLAKSTIAGQLMASGGVQLVTGRYQHLAGTHLAARFLENAPILGGAHLETTKYMLDALQPVAVETAMAYRQAKVESVSLRKTVSAAQVKKREWIQAHKDLNILIESGRLNTEALNILYREKRTIEGMHMSLSNGEKRIFIKGPLPEKAGYSVTTTWSGEKGGWQFPHFHKLGLREFYIVEKGHAVFVYGDHKHPTIKVAGAGDYVTYQPEVPHTVYMDENTRLYTTKVGPSRDSSGFDNWNGHLGLKDQLPTIDAPALIAEMEHKVDPQVKLQATEYRTSSRSQTPETAITLSPPPLTRLQHYVSTFRNLEGHIKLAKLQSFKSIGDNTLGMMGEVGMSLRGRSYRNYSDLTTTYQNSTMRYTGHRAQVGDPVIIGMTHVEGRHFLIAQHGMASVNYKTADAPWERVNLYRGEQLVLEKGTQFNLEFDGKQDTTVHSYDLSDIKQTTALGEGNRQNKNVNWHKING